MCDLVKEAFCKKDFECSVRTEKHYTNTSPLTKEKKEKVKRQPCKVFWFNAIYICPHKGRPALFISSSAFILEPYKSSFASFTVENNQYLSHTLTLVRFLSLSSL